MDKFLRMGYPGENVVLDGGAVSPLRTKKTVVHYAHRIKTQILGSRFSFIWPVAGAAF